MNRTNEEPLYELEGISKSFGHVQALKDIALKVYPGEIIGLVGDNGAGKSTLIKILSGIYKPDQGTIRYKGEIKQVQSYRDSQGIGIATIYQDRALVDSVSIYRNIFMGSEIVNRLGLLDKRKMREDAARVLKQSISIGIQSPDLLVGDLSGGQKQAVAIARAIYFRAQLLLLDEPTNALSVKESGQVMAFVKELRREGISSIFVTHNLYHVYSIADRFVVFSLGEKVGDFTRKDVTIDQLEHMIVEGKSAVDEYTTQTGG
jgi:simple sugar transport system ATP-binding protein